VRVVVSDRLGCGLRQRWEPVKRTRIQALSMLLVAAFAATQSLKAEPRGETSRFSLRL
jgi:hypothetical protein